MKRKPQTQQCPAKEAGHQCIGHAGNVAYKRDIMDKYSIDTPPAPWLPHVERLAAGQACLEAALWFLAHGMPPLCCCDPDHVGVGRKHGTTCTTPGKAPMHPWKSWQTRLPDVAAVHHWWSQYGLGNVGIVLGQGSGVVRVDLDGDAGAHLLTQWSGGDLPDTWEFLSPSGGHGWLYGWDTAVPCRTTTHKTAQARHEELRLMGNGSQTIVPPSRHASGGVYTWVPGHSPQACALAPAPEWLVTRLREPVHPPPTPWSGARPADYDRVTQALSLIPNEDAPYDDWLMIGMALHNSGAPWAREAWDAWSQGSTKFDAGKQEKSWASFGKSPRVVTLGSLFYLADQHGWQPPQRDVPEMMSPDADDPVAKVEVVAHRLPEHLANHPDPRVRQHWVRLYRKTNTLRQRLIQDPNSRLHSLTQGAHHGTTT